jgi:ubiquinone/menaquinone biosynthesis C-methylase UbiE
VLSKNTTSCKKELLVPKTYILLIERQNSIWKFFEKFPFKLIEKDNKVYKQDFDQYAVLKPFNYVLSPVFIDTFKKSLVKLNLPNNSIRILDYGCGDGKCYDFYLKCGLSKHNIYGTEASQLRIDRCNKIGWNNVILTNGSDKLKFQDNFFHIVINLEVIEHILPSSIDIVLAEIKRVLDTKGIFILTTPNYPIKRLYDIYEAFINRKFARLKDDPTHIALYNPIKLTNRLNQYFNIIEILPYKQGWLYKNFKNTYFMHKILAVCTDKK